MTSLRALRGLLVLVGAVALVMGLSGVALGARGVLDGGAVSANVDSELRFFAAWYAAAGVLLLRAAPRVERERAVVATVFGAFFVAACGRVLSAVEHGWPHPVFVALTVVEFLLPVVVLPWQAAVARRAVA